MLESLQNNKFEYKKLTEAEQKSRGILGRLVGVIADTVNATRNGRKYSNELWENVFNNPIMKEKIENRVCFGELGHPEDRTETDIEKIAICLAEQPKKGKDGKLYGVFDILNTPNGRILKQLCDYGCNIGISSRGQGDLITDTDGEEAVDPDTYDCECFDAVLIPGVETARLKYVTEDYHKDKSLKMALQESLNTASDKDRKIMKETLNKLNLNINEAKKKKDSDEEEIKDEFEDIDDILGKEVEPIPAEENAEEHSNEEAPAEDDNDFSASIYNDPDKSENKDDTENEETARDDEKEPVEEPAEKHDSRTDEEIFLDFLSNNFDEEKVLTVANILGIEVQDDDGNVLNPPDPDTLPNDDDKMVNFTDKSKDESDEDKKSDEDEKSKEDKKDEEAKDAKKDDEAVDEGLKTIIRNLREAIKIKSTLENQVKQLQEQLAVSEAKVSATEATCNNYKRSVTRLTKVARANKNLMNDTSELKESLKEKDNIIQTQQSRIMKLMESRKATNQSTTTLTENLKSQKNKYEADIKALNEQLTKANAEINKISNLTESLNKQTALKESYKKLANKSVNKYIEVKADILGLSSSDIKRKLGESYTLEDVDKVCDDLKNYYFNVSKLPISVDRKVGVKITESKSSLANVPAPSIDNDDDVDNTLIRIANLGF